jgi:hypothetical protein
MFDLLAVFTVELQMIFDLVYVHDSDSYRQRYHLQDLNLRLSKQRLNPTGEADLTRCKPLDRRQSKPFTL